MCYWYLNFDLAKIIEKAESKPDTDDLLSDVFADWAYVHYWNTWVMPSIDAISKEIPFSMIVIVSAVEIENDYI